MTLTYKKIKVIIADDHDVYRDGLRMLLSKEPGIEVIGEASDGRKLVEQVKQLRPEVALTDLKMPVVDGIKAIKEMHDCRLPVKCIAISTYDTDKLIVEALEAGAVGYIIKNAEKGEIIEAIKTVYEGHPYYCNSTSSRLVRKISKSKFNPYTKGTLDLFSEREKEIIKLICLEKTSEEIGKILFMSARTVQGFRARILAKMNVKTVAGIVIYAIKNGLYSIED